VFAAGYLAHMQGASEGFARKAVIFRLASVLMALGSMQTKRRIVPCSLGDIKHYSAAVRSAAWGDNSIQALADAGLAASTVSQAQLLNTVPETDPRIIDVMLEQVCLVIARLSLANQGRAVNCAQFVHKVDEQSTLWFCGATSTPQFGAPGTDLDMIRVQNTCQDLFGSHSLRNPSLRGGASAALDSSWGLIQASKELRIEIHTDRVLPFAESPMNKTHHHDLDEALRQFGDEYTQKIKLGLQYEEPPNPHQASVDLDVYMQMRRRKTGMKELKFRRFWRSIEPHDVLLMQASTRKQLERASLLRWLAWRHIQQQLHAAKVKNETSGAIAENTNIPHATLRLMEIAGEHLDGGAVDLKPLSGVKQEAFDMSNLGRIGLQVHDKVQVHAVHRLATNTNEKLRIPGAESGVGPLSKFAVRDSDGLSASTLSKKPTPTFSHLVGLQRQRFDTAQAQVTQAEAARQFEENKRKSTQRLAQFESEREPTTCDDCTSTGPSIDDLSVFEDNLDASFASQGFGSMEDSLYDREAAVLSRSEHVSALLHSPAGHRTKLLQSSPQGGIMSTLDSPDFSHSSFWTAASDEETLSDVEARPARDDRSPYARVETILRERRAFSAPANTHLTSNSINQLHIPPLRSTGDSFARRAARKARQAASKLQLEATLLPPVPEVQPLSREAQQQVHKARKQLASEQGVHHSALPTFGASQYLASQAAAQKHRAARRTQDQAAVHKQPFNSSSAVGETISAWASSSTGSGKERAKAAKRQARLRSKLLLKPKVTPAKYRVPQIPQSSYNRLLGDADAADRKLMQIAKAAFGDAAAAAAVQQAKTQARRHSFA